MWKKLCVPGFRAAHLLSALMICSQGCGEKESVPMNAQPASAVVQSNLAGNPDPETIARFRAIEEQRREVERTTFAPELDAQRHESLFIDLWDGLRRAQGGLGPLADFHFSQLQTGVQGGNSLLEHGISFRRFGSPLSILTSEKWRNLVHDFERQGYRLEESEWRHARFTPGTNGAASSVVFVRLHVRNDEVDKRYILRGNLLVDWEIPGGPNDSPVPRLIDASGLELLERTGAPVFERVLSKVVSRDDGTALVDPLICYDLDGDGLSEIVLVSRNLMFRNGGQGRFQPAPLCQFFQAGITAGIIADFDGDTHPDLLAAFPGGLLLYRGDGSGKFPTPPARTEFDRKPLMNPFVMTAGDVDGDGNLDVWLAQYKIPYEQGQMPSPYYDANDGFPAYLLINDGHGRFVDRTVESGLAAKRFRRAYSSSLIDLDGDGDLDLVMVSDFAGVDFFKNDGKGRFKDSTSEIADETHAFGMAHSFGDYDLDGKLDLLVVGMNSFVGGRLELLDAGPADLPVHQRMRPRMAYGNRLLFGRGDGFQHTPMSDQIARSGWSWGVTTFDFDNDGDQDVYIANGHKSRGSVRDYETQFWMHDIYVGNSEHDAAKNLYFRATATRLYGQGYSYGGYEKNRLFINAGGRSFTEAAYLLGAGMELDSRNVVSDDLDGDGRLDLIVITYEVWPKGQQSLHLFRNQTASSGNWIGFLLREEGRGFTPVGARVTLFSETGSQTRVLVTGDSYRSQHANTAHFGLGPQSRVDRVEIQWPNGRRKTMVAPAINQYHRGHASVRKYDRLGRLPRGVSRHPAVPRSERTGSGLLPCRTKLHPVHIHVFWRRLVQR
jgi:hypothetical protein